MVYLHYKIPLCYSSEGIELHTDDSSVGVRIMVSFIHLMRFGKRKPCSSCDLYCRRLFTAYTRVNAVQSCDVPIMNQNASRFAAVGEVKDIHIIDVVATTVTVPRM